MNFKVNILKENELVYKIILLGSKRISLPSPRQYCMHSKDNHYSVNDKAKPGFDKQSEKSKVILYSF